MLFNGHERVHALGSGTVLVLRVVERWQLFRRVLALVPLAKVRYWSEEAFLALASGALARRLLLMGLLVNVPVWVAWQWLVHRVSLNKLTECVRFKEGRHLPFTGRYAIAGLAIFTSIAVTAQLTGTGAPGFC